jgi:GntR family transcriptional regulator
VEIDMYSDVPSYQQLADRIRARIEDGTYLPKQLIPSISSFQQETGLAINTIRKAIDILVQEGLLVPVRGRGTFVTEPDARRGTLPAPGRIW